MAQLRGSLRGLIGGDHFDRVPRADRQPVSVGTVFPGQADAQFAADAAFQVHLAPRLRAFDAQAELPQFDAIYRTDLDAGFAAGAAVGIDHGQLLGDGVFEVVWLRGVSSVLSYRSPWGGGRSPSSTSRQNAGKPQKAVE